MLTEAIYKALIYDKLSSNLGMVFENVVAQMLNASGKPLYFHEYKYQPENATKEKKYEIDFLTVKNKKICPIKVEDRYIIYTKDLKLEDGITYIPAYMTMCI